MIEKKLVNKVGQDTYEFDVFEEDHIWFSETYKNGALIERTAHRTKEDANEYIAIDWIGG